MGMDISIYVEIKIDGQWKFYKELPLLPRMPALFARICPIRSWEGIKPIDDYRGLPDDISLTVKEAILEGDLYYGCGLTWLNSEEVKSLFTDGYLNMDNDYFTIYTQAKGHLDNYGCPEGTQDFRWICEFNN